MTTERRDMLLVIDDDEAVRVSLKMGLESWGHTVEVADCGRAGLAKLQQRQFDIVVSDLKLPDIDGIEVLGAVKRMDEHCIVLIMTAFASVDTAVEALEKGAFEYFVKPLNFKHMDIVVRRALAHRQQQLAAAGAARESFCGLIGASAEMNKVYAQIRALAKNDLTVLILGETGTGKEMVARAIRELSDRKDAPFVAVNCGALPETLLESELFGHVKGAFTGASSNKRGLFDAAEGGSILLDEIESASAHTQVALLRVLDSGEVRPLGGTVTQTVNTRVLVASNKDLESLVSEGEFREDLFYRLIPAVITLPPLRERVEDIPALVNHFIKNGAASDDKNPRRFSPKALELMSLYPWPGNVRELKHVVQRTVMSSQRPIIRPAGLPDVVRRPTARELLPSLEEIEGQHVRKALELCHWNKSKAARLIRVRRKRLYSLISKHGLDSPREGDALRET